MALNGTPREETARYLDENFDLSNADTILDEVYARVQRLSAATPASPISIRVPSGSRTYAVRWPQGFSSG